MTFRDDPSLPAFASPPPIPDNDVLSDGWFAVMRWINDHSYDGTFWDLEITTDVLWEAQ